MLTKYCGEGATSYIPKTRSEYTYFNLGENRYEIKTKCSYTG